MSFVAKLFGIDTKAQKKAAQAQARALAEQAEATRKQSQAIADQAAQQTRLAQERSRIQDQVATMEQAQPDTAPTVDLVADTGSASRRRKAYASGTALRI